MPDTACCGAGTAGRAWLAAGQGPAASVQPGRHRAAELRAAEAGLAYDQRTGIWGIPVTRRGDPDYAPGNPCHRDHVPDGPLTLPARVFAPDGIIDRSAPAILIASGYGTDVPAGFLPIVAMLTPFAEHGYTTVLVALRQAALSPPGQQVGVRFGGATYADDIVDIVNWLVRRYGCGQVGGDPATAKVGMIGPSLLGAVQWATLKHPGLPPALRAIAPDVIGTAGYTVWYPGGMLPGPARTARPGPEFAHYFPRHRDFDDYWDSQQLTERELEAAAGRGIAVLVTGGWEDYITPAAIDTYQHFRAASGVTRKKLVVGPTGHPTPVGCYTALALPWMDRWLRDAENNADRDRVLIYVQGPNRWRAESEWPLPDARVTRLYLRDRRSDSLPGPHAGTLDLAGPADDLPFGVTYRPDSGPFLKTMLSSGLGAAAPAERRLSLNQAPDEQRTATWTSPPLSEPTEITGTANLILWAASSGTDADFVINLTDVSPDGTSRSVVPGYLNGPRQHQVGVGARAVPARPLTPGVPRQFTVRLWPTSYVFAAGHRIRVALAGGAEPATGDDGTPQPGPQGPGKNPDPFELTILQNRAHPSYLELPVVGTALTFPASPPPR